MTGSLEGELCGLTEREGDSVMRGEMTLAVACMLVVLPVLLLPGCQDDPWNEETYMVSFDSVAVPQETCSDDTLAIWVYGSLRKYPCSQEVFLEDWEDSLGLHLEAWARARWHDRVPCDPEISEMETRFRVFPPLPLGEFSVHAHNPDGTTIVESTDVRDCRRSSENDH